MTRSLERPPREGGRSPRSEETVGEGRANRSLEPPTRGIDERDGELIRLVRSLTGAPSEPGHEVELLENGDDIFPSMLEAIESAVDTVDLLTYVYWAGEVADRFADAAIRAAGRGVRVRLLFDAAGATGLDDDLDRRLTEAGCELRRFRPPRLRNATRLHHRTHRKLLLCDGRVAFTGGVGIADEWAGDGSRPGDWRDLHLRLEGPAVASLEAAFFDNWVDAGGAIAWRDPGPLDRGCADARVAVVASPAEVGAARVRSLVISLFESADTEITIATAYLNPDDVVTDALVAAARRGVAVDVVVPGRRIDKWISRAVAWGHYDGLVRAGIAVHEYEPSMYHAKAITVDERLALLGSPNLNRRSHHLDDEIAIVSVDRGLTRQVREAIRLDISRSSRLGDDWAGPGRWRAVVGSATRPIRPHA